MLNKIRNVKNQLKQTPAGFTVLLYTETCELFGRFGITSLLILYLTQVFHFSDVHAFSVYGSFIALLFIFPVIGGILSDRFLGKTHSIILGASVMGLGNFILSISSAQQVYLWLDYYCDRTRFFYFKHYAIIR